MHTSRKRSSKVLPVLALAATTALVAAGPALAVDEVNTDRTGLALGGYDPVAYFTEGAPTKGNFQITSEHDGATYRFASEANRDRFVADPERYLPRYGGYCAYGVSVNDKFTADPTVWTIVDGKLYLNLDDHIASLFAKDVPGHLEKAETNWKSIEADPAR